MPKLILQFQDRVLKECVVGSHVVKIGRLPDNTIVIDNPAVSSHHARVSREGDHFLVEDLESTNGTFVNGERITRRPLQHGDVVLVGKHTLVFDEVAGDEPAEAVAAAPALPELGGTVLLDAKQRKALLARVEAAARAAGVPEPPPPAEADAPTQLTSRVGVLRVLAGRLDEDEIPLDAHTSLIGKSPTARIQLRGWFKPQFAVAIARKDDGYLATLLGGKARINNEPLTGRRELHEGDVLHVGGLTLEFRMK